MLTARIWFARIVMLYALLVFCFLAYLFIVEPLNYIERFGISANGTPESIGFLRVSVGGLFLGMAITALYGLVRPAHFVAALSVIVLFDGCVVALRLVGIAVDGVTPMQLSELSDEGVAWLLFVAALAAYPRAPVIAE